MLLRKHGGKSAAAGWDGDRYAVFEGPKDRLGLVWLSTWDSEDDAREFTAAYIRYQTVQGSTTCHDRRRNAQDTLWRNAGDRLYVVQRRGLDVAVVEGFSAEATPTLLEAAFRAKKVEMKPDAPAGRSPQGHDWRANSMRISRLELHRVAVPLKKVVKHASFERSVSENLVVRVELADGQVGYGEGVPRPYVTGETVESTFGVLSAARLGAQRSAGRAIFARSWSGSRHCGCPETEADPRGMAGNAARCALELAVLDAFGRRFGESVGRAVELAAVEGLRASSRHPSASGTAGRSRPNPGVGEWRTAVKIRIYGFHQVKVKVGTRGQDDPRRLRALRWILGRRMDIRIDANEAWPASELVERVEPLRRFAPDGPGAARAACPGRCSGRAPAAAGHPGHAR